MNAPRQGKRISPRLDVLFYLSRQSSRNQPTSLVFSCWWKCNDEGEMWIAKRDELLGMMIFCCSTANSLTCARAEGERSNTQTSRRWFVGVGRCLGQSNSWRAYCALYSCCSDKENENLCYTLRQTTPLFRCFAADAACGLRMFLRSKSVRMATRRYADGMVKGWLRIII